MTHLRGPVAERLNGDAAWRSSIGSHTGTSAGRIIVSSTGLLLVLAEHALVHDCS